MIPEIELYTDGSCPVPHQAGGWAYILRIVPSGTERRASGGEKITTNNRMELMGVIVGLKQLPVKCRVKIVSDSQYVVYGISKWLPKWKKANWIKKNYETKKKEPVANSDLWKELDALLSKHIVTAEWIKGHSGHTENEWCDLASGLETKKLVELAAQHV